MLAKKKEQRVRERERKRKKHTLTWHSIKKEGKNTWQQHVIYVPFPSHTHSLTYSPAHSVKLFFIMNFFFELKLYSSERVKVNFQKKKNFVSKASAIKSAKLKRGVVVVCQRLLLFLIHNRSECVNAHKFMTYVWWCFFRESIIKIENAF